MPGENLQLGMWLITVSPNVPGAWPRTSSPYLLGLLPSPTKPPSWGAGRRRLKWGTLGGSWLFSPRWTQCEAGGACPRGSPSGCPCHTAAGGGCQAQLWGSSFPSQQAGSCFSFVLGSVHVRRRRRGAGEGQKGRISGGKDAPDFPPGPPSQARPAVTPLEVPSPSGLSSGSPPRLTCASAPRPSPLSEPLVGKTLGLWEGATWAVSPCVCVWQLWDSVP